MRREGILVGSAERDGWVDFLRALAIILVLVRHFLDRNALYDPYISGVITKIGLFGWSGVDLFFVLSGFLIFSIIFKQEARSEFSWISFYVRRALRIWPAYFFSLAACLACGQFAVEASQLIYFALFIQNYAGPLSELNGGIYWSIAVEEHFYILAPLLLVASGYFRKWRLHILSALVIAPLLVRWGVYEWFVRDQMGPFYRKLYFPTHTRLDSLAMGVLCAYVVNFHRDIFVRRAVQVGLPIAAVVLLVLAVWSTEPLNRYGQHPSFAAGVLGFSLTPMFWALILLIGITFRPLERLGRGPMQVIAYLSYSMYLYHIIVLNYWTSFFRGFSTSALLVVTHAAVFALSTLLAGACSYFVVERYFLIQKRHIGPHRHGKTPVVRPNA